MIGTHQDYCVRKEFGGKAGPRVPGSPLSSDTLHQEMFSHKSFLLDREEETGEREVTIEDAFKTTKLCLL